ncbi:MAG: creatininase family protein [Alsobacter sp.]
MTIRFWADLPSRSFRGLDPETTVAVLPIAATEQHGPHLPVSVDTTIMNGMLTEAMALPLEKVQALVLPTLAVAKSNEHLHSPGTLTLAYDTAIKSWIEIGECVLRAGLFKLVIITSHGGNVDPIGIVCRELRVRHGMLAVQTSWRRFGLPVGVYADLDAVHGIHAGDIETSLMLHFRPDLVDMSAAGTFTPVTVELEEDYRYLRPIGAHASFGWMAQDVHPSGAAGAASLATAEKGRLTAAFQAQGFVDLLREVARFPLARLSGAAPSL